jgi:hypothetical protein
MRSISSRAVLAAVLYAAMAHAGHAQTFYKCLSPQGKPEFLDKPCAAGTRQENRQQAGRTDSAACQQARRQLESAAHAAAPNRPTVEARRSAMEGACGMKAPSQVTIVNPAPYAPRRP